MKESPASQPLSNREVQYLIHYKSMDALQDIDRLIRRHERARERPAVSPPGAGVFRLKKYLWGGGAGWLDWFRRFPRPKYRRLDEVPNRP